MLLSEVKWVLMTKGPVIPCECPGLLKEPPAPLPHSGDTLFPIYCNIYLTTPSSSFRSGLSLFKEKMSLRHLLHDVMSTFHRIYFYPELSCFLKFILHFSRNKNHIHSSCHCYICIYLTIILLCAKFCAYLNMNKIWPVFKGINKISV